MKTRLGLLHIIAFGLTLIGAPAYASGYWRIGGSYISPTSGTTRDRVGNAWGVIGEYSFTHVQAPDDRWDGDVSFGVSYRRFDHDTAAARNIVDWTTFVLKWRGGAGASPTSQGLYGGVGLGAAVFSIRPAFDGLTQREGVTRLEWSVFGGGNIGRRVYVEVGYHGVPDIQSVPLKSFTVTVGLRL